MDCAELNTRTPNNPFLSAYHQMRGFFISSANSPGQGPQLESAKAGDVLTLQARVYNYSLKAMDAGTEVHVRFYFMPLAANSTLPAEPNGNSYLISEQVVSSIPPFDDTVINGKSAPPNWVLVSSPFDTSQFAETRGGNVSVAFWVLVWMQDASGKMIGEMPGHGLTAIPPAGTINSNGETTFHFSGVPSQFKGATDFEECQPAQTDGTTPCYSNNLAFYQQSFYIAGSSLGASPRAASATIDIGKVEVSADRITPRENVTLSANLSVTGAPASGVRVNFYDGDPKKGGQPIGTKRIPYIAEGAQYMVQTLFQSNTCGVHQLFAVVNRGKSSEVVRRAHPVRVDCNANR
jgi:hypothetical protein